MLGLRPCDEALRAAEAKTRELESAAMARAKADAAELDTSARDEAMRRMLTEILNPKLPLLTLGEGDGNGNGNGNDDDGMTPVRPNRLASTAAAVRGLDPQAIALAAEARDVRKEADFISRLGRLQVELAASKDREEVLKTGLLKSHAAVEDNAQRREKCVQLKAEIVALRGKEEDARRSAAEANEAFAEKEVECAALRVRLHRKEAQLAEAAALWRSVKMNILASGTAGRESSPRWILGGGDGGGSGGGAMGGNGGARGGSARKRSSGGGGGRGSVTPARSAAKVHTTASATKENVNWLDTSGIIKDSSVMTLNTGVNVSALNNDGDPGGLHASINNTSFNVTTTALGDVSLLSQYDGRRR